MESAKTIAEIAKDLSPEEIRKFKIIIANMESEHGNVENETTEDDKKENADHDKKILDDYSDGYELEMKKDGIRGDDRDREFEKF